MSLSPHSPLQGLHRVNMRGMSDGSEDGRSPGAEVKMKKSRASKPKVKTGCQTCKIRRVKCDETKPNCLRCLKFGHQCDGYTPRTLSKNAVPGTPSRTLVPKNPSAVKSQDEIPATSPPLKESTLSRNPSLSTPPSELLFQNEQEYRYFQHFCTQTSNQLSNFFTRDLWTRLMLQACESSPPIRHAVIAIGALNLSQVSARSNEVGTLRHQFAFRQYNKSICLMRRDVAGGRHDLRTTLIACLLFYCFESFHGYHELAISQVYTGLRMIRDWTTSFYKPDATGRRNIKIGSENPYVIEDDILRAFGNLEIQVMTYADGRNADLHEHYRHCGQASIDEMPAVFQDLTEARTMLELVIRRSMHWLRSTMHLHNFGTEKLGHFEDGGSKPFAMRDSFDRPASLFFDVDPRFEEQSATVKEYERWDAAFQPLLRKSREPEGKELIGQANTLRLHWLAGYMSIASNNCPTSLINGGRFTKELKELVGIARFMLEEEKNGRKESGFVFDMQIIVPLMTVGWVYRHRALRKEAIELLLRSPRKEGVWDGIVIGKIMAFLAEVEEEGMGPEEQDAEYVPETATARGIKMSFEVEAKEARVSCLQPVKGSLIGEEVRREIVIPW